MTAPWGSEMPDPLTPLSDAQERLLPLLAVAALGDGWRRYYVQRVSAEHAARIGIERAERALEVSPW